GCGAVLIASPRSRWGGTRGRGRGGASCRLRSFCRRADDSGEGGRPHDGLAHVRRDASGDGEEVVEVEVERLRGGDEVVLAGRDVAVLHLRYREVRHADFGGELAERERLRGAALLQHLRKAFVRFRHGVLRCRATSIGLPRNLTAGCRTIASPSL